MFGPHSVTVVHRGEGPRDAHNNPTVVELSTEVLNGCNLQQMQSDEELEARESAVTRWVLFAPAPATRIGVIDQFRIDAASVNLEPDEGQTYATLEQDGEPDYLHNFDGTTHHLELILRRVHL